MIVKLTSALLILHLNLAESGFIRNGYSIDLYSVTVCPNNEKLESPIKNLKYVHINRTHRALSYNVTWKRPLDEKIGLLFETYRWGDGGWINVPFLGYQSNFCRTLKGPFGEYWVYTFKQMGIKNPDKCPIPAGNYTLENFMIDGGQVFHTPFFSGSFKVVAEFQIDKTKTPIYCSVANLKVIEVL